MSDLSEKKGVEPKSKDKILALFDEMLHLTNYLVRMCGSDVQSAKEGLSNREVRDCMLQHAVSESIHNLVAQARAQYVTKQEKGWQDKTLDAQISAIRSPFAKPVQEAKSS
jgi:hypothetical protein